MTNAADLRLRVGRRLRALRLAEGLSQYDLELRSGIPKARQSRYENAHVMPSLETLDALTAELGVTLAQFFLGT